MFCILEDEKEVFCINIMLEKATNDTTTGVHCLGSMIEGYSRNFSFMNNKVHFDIGDTITIPISSHFKSFINT